MAHRSRYGAKTGSRRPASSVPSRPVGILYCVLLDHWMSLPPDLRGHGPEEGALVTEGFFASPGMGCDMTADRNDGGSSVKSRCGDPPCAWFSYQLRAGGVTLGVRACSEHVQSAPEEAMWHRRHASAAEFAAWEVMTG